MVTPRREVAAQSQDSTLRLPMADQTFGGPFFVSVVPDDHDAGARSLVGQPLQQQRANVLFRYGPIFVFPLRGFFVVDSLAKPLKRGSNISADIFMYGVFSQWHAIWVIRLRQYAQ
jgi:hypothetical protein